MRQCSEYRELFSLALYNELSSDDRDDLDRHLAGCPSCEAEFSSLRQLLRVMNEREFPEPSEAYWTEYWNRLKQSIDADPHAARQAHRFRPSALPAWAYGIAAILLVGVGIYLGRNYFVTPPPPLQQTSIAIPPPATDTVDTRALEYFERSKNLLIGLVNLDKEHESSIDLTRHQQRSRDLVNEGVMLKAALNKPDQQQMRQLVLDLEIVLQQLANIEVRPGVPAVQLVKKGVDQKSLLLKINLEEMRAMLRRPKQSEKNVKPHI